MTNNTKRNKLTALLAVLGAVLGAILALTALTAPAASASAWDPHVAVTGRVTCSPYISTTPSWMWYTATNGEQGWAQLTGSGITKSYRIDLNRVGTGGTTLNITYGCSNITQSKSSFGVKRPAIGSYTTRNICPTWWTGPCII